MTAEALPVPFFDWKALYDERAADYAQIIQRTAANGAFILQADVDEFEAKLADFVGVKHAIGVSDCTNAMLLGLRASDIRPGDEILLPAHAFIAAAQSIHFAGAIPVPVEIAEGDGWLVDPQAVEAAVTPRTRGIMAVHVNGRLCPMDALSDIAERRNLDIYEDSAQALGATLDGRCGGSFGRWGAFSFYPSKTLGCFGDAGALVTNDGELASRVRAMRNHGAAPDKTLSAQCAVWGTNARIDNVHAAILSFKLDWYDQVISRRRAIAARYHQAFSTIASLALPPEPASSGRQFDIFQNYEICCDSRDSLRSHLADRGIGTIVQWGGVGIHQFRGLGFTQDLPRADAFFRRSLLLPMNHLLNDDQVRAVINAVRAYFA